MKQRIIYAILLALCLTALAGYLMPLMSINIDVFDRVSQSMDISIGNILSIRSDADSPFGGIDSSESVFSGMLGGGEGMSEITGKLMISIGLYLVAFILLLVVLVFSEINKLKKTSIAILALSLSFYVYIGFTVSNLAADIIGMLEQRLGFFAMLFNLSEMITVSLGNGYWITLAAICCMVLVKLVQIFQKNNEPRMNSLS
jgi:hypothetical protein